MSLAEMLQDDITISRAPASTSKDAYGNPSESYVDDAAPTKGFIQVPNQAETISTEGADTVVTDPICFFGPDISITSRDRVKWNGRTFDVVGVMEERKPGSTHHLKVVLREYR